MTPFLSRTNSASYRRHILFSVRTIPSHHLVLTYTFSLGFWVSPFCNCPFSDLLLAHKPFVLLKLTGQPSSFSLPFNLPCLFPIESQWTISLCLLPTLALWFGSVSLFLGIRSGLGFCRGLSTDIIGVVIVSSIYLYHRNQMFHLLVAPCPAVGASWHWQKAGTHSGP